MSDDGLVTGLTRGESKRRLSKAFELAHDEVAPERRLRIEVTVLEDADNYYTIEHGKGLSKVEVSDVFLDAPDRVQMDLALVIISKCYKVPFLPRLWHTVRDHLGREEVKERSRQVFQRAHKLVMPSPRGDHHDLRSSLARVKKGYFPDGLGFKDPAVLWSRRRSHRRWGYWMEDYDVIVVNRILDGPKVPEKVVDFIVYHELLHKVHGSINISGARESHHHRFNVDERRFEGWKEMEAFLEKVYKSKGRCLK